MHQAELPRTLKIATVWMLLGLAVFLGVQLFERQQRQARFQVDGGTVEIRRGSDGHYHWPGRIQGRAVDFLVDTGATRTAIPLALARELRLPELGAVQSNTAGGVVRGVMAQADVQLEGGVAATQLRVVALPGLEDGRPLLGMDVLGRLAWSQEGGVLRVELSSGGR